MNNVDDKELLYRAARTAGIPSRVVGAAPGTYFLYPDTDGVEKFTCMSQWNPLNDYGDALRLAEAKHMTVTHEPSRGGWSVGAVFDGEFRWLAHDDDVRRAITLAAAA